MLDTQTNKETNNRLSLSVIRFCFLIALTVIVVSCSDDEKEIPQPEIQLQFKYPLSLAQFEIPEDNPLSLEGIELGRKLFYDNILSLDSSVSCASCHKQALAFSDSRKFSLGVKGQLSDRNSMSLSNLVFADEFFWDGRASGLEQQALLPIENPIEMNLPISEALKRLSQSPVYPTLFKKVFHTENITADQLAKVISQFERTLISHDSKYDQSKRGEYTMSDLEKLGEELFYTHPERPTLRGGNCGDCHAGTLQSRFTYHRNGIDSTFSDVGRFTSTSIPDDIGKFKTPSLRNIELTAPYMHDGRFATLEEVLDHYNEHVNITRKDIDPLMQHTNNDEKSDFLALTPDEKTAIIAFLKTLTDHQFINNKNFSKPE